MTGGDSRSRTSSRSGTLAELLGQRKVTLRLNNVTEQAHERLRASGHVEQEQDGYTVTLPDGSSDGEVGTTSSIVRTPRSVGSWLTWSDLVCTSTGSNAAGSALKIASWESFALEPIPTATRDEAS